MEEDKLFGAIEGHKLSRYQRPFNKFRCGRASEWNRPCELGPHVSGRCGGTKECVPARLGDRWECRRSALYGGPCQEGPGSDGTCAHTHPPCRPTRSLRNLRGILTICGFSLVVAIIALTLTIGGATRDSIIDAGDLTNKHANLASVRGCVSCHKVHDQDAGDWLLAAFREKDMTEQCLDCHLFGGDARLGHNAKFATNSRATECVMCHTEHTGEDANIKLMSDSQCNACHEVKISAFNRNHPEFGPTYPHDGRTAVRFDHFSHLSKHFLIPRNIDLAPQRCATCHQTKSAEKAVEPAGYDEMCADCHTGDITGAELVLLSLPEFEQDQIDHEAIAEVCEPTLEEWESTQEILVEMTDAVESGESFESEGTDEDDDEDEYLSVSENKLSRVSAYLLGVPYDDMDEYSKSMQDFVARLADEGPAPVAEIIDERASAPLSGMLLSGLSPELVTRMACAWANNYEFVPRIEHELGGWHADEDGLSLRYAPAGHGDGVAKSWINFALLSMTEEDEDYANYAELMRQTLLFNPIPGKRFGACTKCHAISDDGGELNIEWRYRRSKARRYTNYSHNVHFTIFNPEGVSLMDPDRSCRTCHKINDEATYGEAFEQGNSHNFQSNFFPVSLDTCARCHDDEQAPQNCQLCHVYHLEPSVDLRIDRHHLFP